ncbi:translocase of chloroplast 159, chloroplastic-like, partial [Phalaenopsis equestris]|uniref:translocase of chloroplast 159, chloroplastic-like n=1 Tax=Phalaenopsis equestris TaxID=78828 RepID=UPI0009E5E252
MFPLPMGPRPASSGFPFAIRARLSAEDSSSDASSFIAGDSDDNSGVDELEEEAAEDNSGSLRRPFIPIARVTGDDEDDDVVDELLFDDEEEVKPKLVVGKLEVESWNGGRDEDFGGGFESGREESGLFYGNEVKGDSLGVYEDTLILSEEELRVQEKEKEKEKGYVEVVERVAASSDDAGAVEGGLELNDVNQNKGFELEVKDLLVDSSIIESEKCNLVGDIDSTQNSVMDVELRTLGAESEAVDSLIPEVEDDPVEIVTIKAAGDVASSRHWNEEAEAKFSQFEDMEEEVGGDLDSKNCFLGEKMFEVSEVKAHSTESERFGAPDAVCFSHSSLLEMLSLHDNKAFERKDEVLHMKISSVDSVNAKDSTFKLLVSTDGNHSPYGKEMDSIDSYHLIYDEDLAEENEHGISEWPHSESMKCILKEIDEGSSTSHSSFESSQTYSNILGIQNIYNSDEEMEIDEDDNAKELFETSALAALLRPSHGTSFGVPHHTSQNTCYVNDLKVEEQMLYSKIERIRAKYLRLVEIVGVGFIYSVSRGRKTGAKNVTFLYDEGEDEFALSCTILVLGKTGVGKRALSSPKMEFMRA